MLFNCCCFSPRHTAKIPDDEWNLLYVAVTRAKTTLIITKNIRRIITMAGVRNSHTVHLTSYPIAVQFQ